MYSQNNKSKALITIIALTFMISHCNSQSPTKIFSEQGRKIGAIGLKNGGYLAYYFTDTQFKYQFNSGSNPVDKTIAFTNLQRIEAIANADGGVSFITDNGNDAKFFEITNTGDFTSPYTFYTASGILNHIGLVQFSSGKIVAIYNEGIFPEKIFYKSLKGTPAIDQQEISDSHDDLKVVLGKNDKIIVAWKSSNLIKTVQIDSSGNKGALLSYSPTSFYRLQGLIAGTGAYTLIYTSINSNSLKYSEITYADTVQKDTTSISSILNLYEFEYDQINSDSKFPVCQVNPSQPPQEVKLKEFSVPLSSTYEERTPVIHTDGSHQAFCVPATLSSPSSYFVWVI